MRLDIRRKETLKKGNEEFGIRVRVKVAKNKVAPPFRLAEFDIIFGRGISTKGCLLDMAEELKIVSRKGAWYSYKGENVAQGRDKTVQYLETNPEVAQEIEEQIRHQIAAGATLSVTKSTKDEDDVEEDEDTTEEF